MKEEYNFETVRYDNPRAFNKGEQVLLVVQVFPADESLTQL